MKILASLLVAAFLMAGCAGVPKQTLEIAVPTIPNSMLYCVPPAYRNKKFVRITPKQMAYLLSRQSTSADDCYSKLEQVRKLYYGQKKRATKGNVRARRG